MEVLMKTAFLASSIAVWCLASGAWAASPLQGEIELEAASRLERDAGVWLDGQYVGFVKDLEGRGRLALVPGTHELLFKLIGYEDVARTVVVEPGDKKRYRVTLSESENVTYPDRANTAQLRLSVKPGDAAIFINDSYVGHVDRFGGRGGMRLSPGTYRFTIALPGYQPFNTELTVRAGQTYEIKTELPKGQLGDQPDELTARAAPSQGL
jgi:hypothetical protein